MKRTLILLILLLVASSELFTRQSSFQTYRIPAGEQFLEPYQIGFGNQIPNSPDLTLKAQCIVRGLDPIPRMTPILGFVGQKIVLEVINDSGEIISKSKGSWKDLGIEIFGLNNIYSVGLKLENYDEDLFYKLTFDGINLVADKQDDVEKYYDPLLQVKGPITRLDQILEVSLDHSFDLAYSKLEWSWIEGGGVKKADYQVSCYILSSESSLIESYEFVRNGARDMALDDSNSQSEKMEYAQLFDEVNDILKDLTALKKSSELIIREYSGISESSYLTVNFNGNLPPDLPPYSLDFGDIEPPNGGRLLNEYYRSENDECGISSKICLGFGRQGLEPEAGIEIECKRLGKISFSTSGIEFSQNLVKK